MVDRLWGAGWNAGRPTDCQSKLPLNSEEA